ncbi:hypothetical protein GALMADRAFT_250667 [Galerina marginata CBS 339.88]|uniref:NTF2 domain-containing protein n=1 Tax=Galerina marginata (strain CBS 339.88) TaxID=685588 RepID=A0A067SSW5_GALM3|nr:hypothetical protein GALMADRAFT_250667 [Galerina marginata CBS 339.88]
MPPNSLPTFSHQKSLKESESTMSAAIVLPTLTNWTKNHITAIFQATNKADFTSSINAFLSDKASITLNGVKTSRAEFVSKVQAEKFDESGAVVSFISAVEVPKDGEQPVVAGSVGVSYNAIVAEGIVIRDAAITRQVTASVNVVIEQDPDVPKPPPSPIHGFFDGRRVMSLNQVSIEGPVPTQSA